MKDDTNMATNEEAIIRHRQFLEERMDPDFGLLNTLLANRTLSWKETSEVKDKSPFYKRNSKLLDYILEKKQYSDLIWALGGNEQTHIVNYLNANGGIQALNIQVYEKQSIFYIHSYSSSCVCNFNTIVCLKVFVLVINNLLHLTIYLGDA